MWLSSDRVLVGFEGSQKIGNERQVWGAARVFAYEKNSGNELWSGHIPGANRILFLSGTEEAVFAIGNTYYSLVQLDAKTGQQENPNDHTLVLFDTERIQYIYNQQGSLISAVQFDSGELIWQRKQPFQNIIYIDDVLLVKMGDGQVGIVKAIDAFTGEILWKQKGVVSNLAAANGTVYLISFLDLNGFFGGGAIVDAHLIAVDSRTGELIDTLGFEPSGIQSGNGQYTYNVAASDDMGLVYLGDGKQLFAFRFLGSSE